MINWRVRFTRANLLFVVRFLAALFIPVLAYMGVQFNDITSWSMLWQLTLQFLSNPALVFMTLFNAFNMTIDPTTKGLSDSKQALSYRQPRK